MTMLRRPVRNPVFAAWKRNVRRSSLFPRPSFLILKVTREEADRRTLRFQGAETARGVLIRY